MPNKEKVIKAFEDIIKEETYPDRPRRFMMPLELAEQVLALLKEQEAKIEQLNRFVNGFSRDAMPVVRCKDCINCVKEPNGKLYCDILAVGYEPLGSKKVTDDWFCADGERRRSGNELEK